jgi:hypothetical protein
MAGPTAPPVAAGPARCHGAATPHAAPAPPDRFTPMTAPPIPSTGDEAADEELALLRSTTQAIHSAQQQVVDLSLERMRLVLSLRRRTPPVKFATIADAVPTTENTVYKIHREARRAEERGELA